MTGKRMLIDTSKCIGCRACQVACQQWHSLTAEDTTFTGSYTNPPELSGTNLTLIKFFEIEKGGQVQFHFVTDRCRHCDNPNCKAACPLKAIKRQPNGIVRINTAKCNPTLCSTEDIKPCQAACPFKINNPPSNIGTPRRDYVKNGSTVSTKMMKCDFCYNRLGTKGQALGLPVGAFASSLKPACEVNCSTGAIKSGPALKMKRKANRRVTYLKANGYPNANVYPAGLQTHVIWVLLEPPYTYGFASA